MYKNFSPKSSKDRLKSLKKEKKLVSEGRRRKRVRIQKKQVMVSVVMKMPKLSKKLQAKKVLMIALKPVLMMKKSRKQNWKKQKKEHRPMKRQKRFNTSARQSLSLMPAQRNRLKHMRSLTTWHKSLSAKER